MKTPHTYNALRCLCVLIALIAGGCGDTQTTVVDSPPDDLPHSFVWKQAPQTLQHTGTLSDDVAWTSGDAGFFITTDGGRSWNKTSPHRIVDVSFPNRTTGFALITDSGVTATLKTEDGGRQWSRLPPALPNDTLALSFSSPLNGMIVCPSEILLTNDGGNTWSTREAAFGSRTLDMSALSDQTVIVTTETHIFRSVDAAQTWTKQPLLSVPVFGNNGDMDIDRVRLSFTSSTHGMAIQYDTDGHVWSAQSTVDGGKEWSVFAPATLSNYLPHEKEQCEDIEPCDDDTVWLCISYQEDSFLGVDFIPPSTVVKAYRVHKNAKVHIGTPLLTNTHLLRAVPRQSVTLSRRVLESPESLQVRISSRSSAGLIALSHGSQIHTITSEGSTTAELYPRNPREVFPIGVGVMGVRTSESHFGTTRDSGDSWSLSVMKMSGINRTRFSGMTGYMVGDSGQIHFSDDGGANWIRESLNRDDDLQSVFLTTDGSAWVVGDGGSIFTKGEGTDKWTKITHGYESEFRERDDGFNDIAFADAKHGWVVGSDGVILSTDDGGSTWSRQGDENGARDYHAVCFIDATHGWIVGDEIILSTSNRGKTWVTQLSAPALQFDFVDFSSPVLGIVGGEYTPYLITTDGGEKWSEITALGIDGRDVSFDERGNAWAAGESITIGQRGVDAAYVKESDCTAVGAAIKVQWRIEHSNPESVEVTNVDVRRRGAGQWLQVDTSGIQKDGGDFALEWSPAAVEYGLSPGTEFEQRITLRDGYGTEYRHVLPNTMTYMAYWQRQSPTSTVVHYIVIAVLVYTVACACVCVVHPMGLVTCYHILPTSKLIDAFPDESWQRTVLSAVAAVGVPFVKSKRTKRAFSRLICKEKWNFNDLSSSLLLPYSTSDDCRKSWLDLYVKKAATLDDLPQVTRDEFLRHDDTLDAIVMSHIEGAREAFQNLRTVDGRRAFVPLPVRMNGTVVRDFQAVTLQSAFRNSQNTNVLITGQGGSGKTSLACRIAKWSMSEDIDSRLTCHLMLPVLIEDEIDESGIVQAARGRLQSLIGAASELSNELFLLLLRKKRVLVIIDHFSEMTDETRHRFNPDEPDFPVAALIVTSRIEEMMHLSKTTLEPELIDSTRIIGFAKDYLAYSDNPELRELDDDPLIELCLNLKRMVGERMVTPLLATLYLNQFVDDKKTASSSELPKNIPDLMLRYVDELHQNAEADRKRQTQTDAKILAWLCLEETFQPSKTELDKVLKKLGKEDGEARLEYLEKTLHLITVTGLQHDQIRFTLDPLAEYLAGMQVVELYKGNPRHWDSFLRRAKEKNLEKTAGFLLAVRDCCLASDANVPERVVDELGRLGGLDPEELKRNQTRLNVEQCIENLKSPVFGIGEKACEEISRIGPAAAKAVPHLKEVLAQRDELLPFVMNAFESIGRASVSVLLDIFLTKSHRHADLAGNALLKIGPEADEASNSLIGILGDEADERRELAARILGRIGPKARHALPSLSYRLQHDVSPSVRGAAGLSLASIDIEKTLPLLKTTIQNEEEHMDVRVTVIRGLEHAGSSVAIPILSDVLDDDVAHVRFEANKALQSLDETNAISLIQRGMTDEDASVRNRIINTAKRQPENHLPKILSVGFVDPVKDVRKTAMNILQQKRVEPETVEKLVSAIVSAAVDECVEKQRAGQSSLRMFGDEVVPSLIKIAEDGDSKRAEYAKSVLLTVEADLNLSDEARQIIGHFLKDLQTIHRQHPNEELRQHGRVITTANLGQRCGINLRFDESLKTHLIEVAEWCKVSEFPPLISLVVNSETQRPPDYYDEAPGCSLDEWEAQNSECLLFEWYPDEAPPAKSTE